MSKKGISQIKGPSEIRLGETAYYEVSRIYDLNDREKVNKARWKLYALDFDQHDNWRELKPAAGTPPKIGHRIPLTITKQALVGSELMLEAFIYEAEKRIPPGLRIKVLPGLKKKITRVELSKVDNTPIKENTVMKYGQTIKVKVYTYNMPDEMVKLSLYEDDVDGGGHSPKNKNNLVAQITKALNKKGFLWHEFKLDADFSKIANAMMDGTHDKLHEYYVVVETAEHRSVSKNVDVQNPDYIKVQTVSSGKTFDNEKVYYGGEIKEVVVKGKLKRQYGVNHVVDTGDKVVTVFKPDEKKKEEKCLCKQYDLIWGDKVSCEFRKKVVEICADLWGEKRKIEMANGLMAVMNVETDRSFKAHQIMGKPLKDVNSITKDDFWLIRKDKNGKIISKTSRAVGLIQFTQAALQKMHEFKEGSGIDQLHEVKLKLAKMGEVKQLDYVKKYFEPVKDNIKSPEDIYLHVFAPKGVGKANDYVLYDKQIDGEKYKQNQSIDNENNKDGKIQRIEILGRYRSSYTEGLGKKEKQFSCEEKTKSLINNSEEKCPSDCSQCFEYTDVVTNPRINNQSDNVNKNRFKRERRFNSKHRKPIGYFHTGVDILAPIGTSLHTLLCGEVIEAYDTKGDLGIIVTVKSTDKEGSLIWIKYCHLSSTKVSKNDKIKHGTVIGLSGNTGNAKGILPKYYHVHIEASRDGVFYGGKNRVDPEQFMKTKFDTTKEGNPKK
ncbi:M23 family metallopeptidase [Chryseobacterium wanjuense]